MATLGLAIWIDWIERPNELGFTSWFRSFWGKWSISDEADKFQDDEADEFEEDDELDGSEPMPYQPRDWSFKAKNKAFLFWTSQFIWDPTDPLYFLFKDVLGFSGDFFVVEEIAKAKGILPTQTKKNPSKSISIADSLFLNTTQEKYFRKVLRLVD